jgi:hypothetical protein
VERAAYAPAGWSATKFFVGSKNDECCIQCKRYSCHASSDFNCTTLLLGHTCADGPLNIENASCDDRSGGKEGSCGSAACQVPKTNFNCNDPVAPIPNIAFLDWCPYRYNLDGSVRRVNTACCPADPGFDNAFLYLCQLDTDNYLSSSANKMANNTKYAQIDRAGYPMKVCDTTGNPKTDLCDGFNDNFPPVSDLNYTQPPQTCPAVYTDY